MRIIEQRKEHEFGLKITEAPKCADINVLNISVTKHICSTCFYLVST